MAVILYAAESLAVLGFWVLLRGIQLFKSKLDTLGWSYLPMIMALATVMNY